jgi:mRNA-degrading endonuclease toxin of MazEF toxin-antitoxin module
VSKAVYRPARGDIIHFNFTPDAGIEFALPHFALVLSTQVFSRQTGLSIVLPMTTKYHHDKRLQTTQLMVRLPKLLELKEDSWVYTHQIKTIDYRERGAVFKTRIPDDELDFLIDVMDRVRALIDPDSAV